MKKHITLTFLIIFSFINAQVNNKLLKVDYNEYRIYIPSIVNIDYGTLIVSSDHTYYKSTLGIRKQKKGKLPDDVIIKNFGTEVLSEYVANKKENLFTEYLTETMFLNKSYAASEPIPKMSWKLLKETKKIQNYLCRKATTTFRGRIYEAWYTDKIPVGAGPWKFSGLPGLILEIQDSNKIFRWEVKSIIYPFQGNSLKEIALISSNKKFKKLTLQEYDNVRIGAMKQKIATAKARNINRSEGGVGLTLSTEQNKEPFYPWRTETMID